MTREFGDELAREENNAAADATLQTAEYNESGTQLAALAGAVNTPWAEYLAGAASAKSAWWTSNLPMYTNYQDALAGDQAAESIGAALAAVTV